MNEHICQYLTSDARRNGSSLGFWRRVKLADKCFLRSKCLANPHGLLTIEICRAPGLSHLGFRSMGQRQDNCNQVQTSAVSCCTSSTYDALSHAKMRNEFSYAGSDTRLFVPPAFGQIALRTCDPEILHLFSFVTATRMGYDVVDMPPRTTAVT